METVSNPIEQIYDIFRELSYDALKARLDGIRKGRHDDRRYREYRKRELRDVRVRASRVRNPEKRRWLSRAESVYEVDFIAKAKPDL